MLMSLNNILYLHLNVSHVLVCTDSRSALEAIRSSNSKIRLETITEINHVIHLLSDKGTSVSFCWVPSHCGISANERVDQAARKAARNVEGSIPFNIPLDLTECNILLNKTSDESFRILMMNSDTQYYQSCVKFCGKINSKASSSNYLASLSREIRSLLHRMRLNSLRTKFCKNIRCMCGETLGVGHLLINCPRARELYRKSGVCSLSDGSSPSSVSKILNDYSFLSSVCKCMLHSPVGIYL